MSVCNGRKVKQSESFIHFLMVICVAVRCSLLKFLIAVCLLQFIFIVYTQAEGSVYYSCPNTTTYTDNSTYQANLNSFFSRLSSNNFINSLFNNTIVGENGSDAIYGQFLCRGDLTVEACSRCVQNAPSAIIQRCPKDKEAYIWYDDKCMLRYNHISFFGIMAEDPNMLLTSPSSVTNPDSLDRVVKDVLEELITRASGVVGPVRFFATRTVNFTSNLSSKLYHLAQCTPDLSSSDCFRCLRATLDTLLLDGYQGARVLSPSCNIRYESDPFYNNIVDSTAPISPSGSGGFPVAAIVVIVGVVTFSIMTMCFCFLRKRAKKKHNMKDTLRMFGGNDNSEADCLRNDISEADYLQYDLRLIKVATNDFSVDNKIGQGGFGQVFKGSLHNGQQIAVKRLSKTSEQGDQEFKNEVIVVAKLQHINLVRLLGYCLEKEEKILIFEFVPNKSLDFMLFDQEEQQSLDWSRRYKIIGGVARGILYLHEDSRLRIIHRDIKASNVLLDKDMNPKISDFGLARIVGLDKSEGNTRHVVGTFGYMSPEYVMYGKFSVKSDVFSFGVLLLEIISGKRNDSFYQNSDHLPSHVWKLWKDGKPLELMDPTLGDSFDKNEVTRSIHIALLCVQKDVVERPTMASVVHMLNSSSMTLPIPHQPAFLLAVQDPALCSANGVTMSEFYPR